MSSVNIDKEALLTQEYLKSILHYDTETGNFTWLEKTSPYCNVYVGNKAGTLTKGGYIRIVINKIPYAAHRLAWLYMTGNWPEFDIDHIKGINIPNFNKWINLRDTNRNRWNPQELPVNNTTGFRGVYLDKRTGKYRARICKDGKLLNLGIFVTSEEASFAYEAAKLIYHPMG